jgi:aminoglycoside/choline kinase family phosphotransferase
MHMAGLDIPAGPQNLTPAWLTRALRETGTITSAKVNSFDMKTGIQEGTGFMGELARIRPKYDRPEERAPQSLIAKLPAAAPENREVAMFFRFYEREVRFYQQIADTVELKTPRCYYSAFEPETGDYVLLLEDLAPARVGDQLAGCTMEQAELCIRELAKFHATWWEHPRLGDLDWMPSIDADWFVASAEESYAESWEPFVEHFGHHLSPDLREIGERFGRSIRALMHQLGTRPRTIVHGDYRLDNLFFGAPEGGDPLAVIDWQISSRGRGVFDVAYFTAGTLPPADRKAKETDLLRMYHRILTENGVQGYDFDQCWADYRLSVLFCLIYSVIAMGSLDLANERGVALFTTILKRTLAAITDLDAGELLPA